VSARLAIVLLAAALLAACAPGDEYREDWVIRAKVEFRSADLARARKAPPAGSYRLWFPFVTGDFYGNPTTGDFFQVPLQPDGAFVIDLNRGHGMLLKSLHATKFSLKFMRMEPVETRIARLLPYVMQADGIERVGEATWIDADTRQRLMLVYLDRKAQIAGIYENEGRRLRYDIRNGGRGYVWVGESGGESDRRWQVSRPRAVSLAVTPIAR
jgi:hypothetical protein